MATVTPVQRGSAVQSAEQPRNSLRGLSAAEAAQRLQQEGYNELPTAGRRNFLALALSLAKEPMLLLLLAAAVIYLFLGDMREAVVLLASVSVVIGITLYQEQRSERALNALRDLSSPRALVIRDGVERRIAGREVVRGDLVILAEGDRVPADGILLEATNLSVDESLLTGESVPVRKITRMQAEQRKKQVAMQEPTSKAMMANLGDVDSTEGNEQAPAFVGHPGGDDLPYVYSSTMVVQGTGLIEAQRTGAKTEIGQIGRSLKTLSVERTPMQQEVARLVRILAVAAFALCAFVLLVYGIVRGNWLEGVLAGITLAMSIIPEEFPLVLTLFLALGAWRLAQRQVLTRRMPAIETLGATTVLCSDKTGTLTQNRMSVSSLVAALRSEDAGGIHYQEYEMTAHAGQPDLDLFTSLVRASVLASQSSPFDPMERALHELADQVLPSSESVGHGLTLVREYPLTSELLAVTRVWQVVHPAGVAPESRAATEESAQYILATKGAPEAVADVCGLDHEQREEMFQEVRALADKGLRVLAVAEGRLTADLVNRLQSPSPSHVNAIRLPDTPHGLPLKLLGLVGLADPIRETVLAAIRDCDTAGIRVIMITGDYPTTAQSIARQIGLRSAERVVTGPELETMSDGELRDRVRETAIFARVVPQQKLRLVQALKANHEIVGMTGDGVNDAPALRAANIGVAMGGRGTDVAREAAAIVLLDDDFTSIVAAVRGGRRIFDNLRKAIDFIVAVHIPIAALAILPVLFGWPLILLPVHIVFLEFIIDPACTLVFEAEPAEPDIMRRPPRAPDTPLFSMRLLLISVLQGLSVLAAVLAMFLIALRVGQTQAEARTLAFATLVVADLALILVNRSWSHTILETLRRPNAALWLVMGGALMTLALVIYVPFLASLFQFATLHPNDVIMCLMTGFASILWFEALKLVQRRIAPARSARAR
jgi:Ca2+-transporting ATPase